MPLRRGGTAYLGEICYMADEEQLLRDHKATWSSFCRVITWSVVAIAVVLLLMRCTLV